MNISFKKNPKQIELIQATGSRNVVVAREAQEAFAGYVGPVIQKVLDTVGTSNLIYTPDTYNEDDLPSYPVDNYRNEGEDYIQVWSQNMAGGLGTSEVSGSGELKFTTYPLNSAVSIAKKYARKSRVEQVAKMLKRMANEVLVKQENNSWLVILKALSEASTNGADHFNTSLTQDVFVPGDISALITLIKRFNTSYSLNSSTQSFGLTDLICSPEIKGQVRGFAYNPVNTVGNTSTGPVTVPESVRTQIYNSVGAESIFNVNLIDIVEFGLNSKYNRLFSTLAPASLAHGSQTFDPADDELLVGLDLSSGRDGFVRPLAQNADNGATFTVSVDDQWVARTDKMGYYGGLEEGRICLDPRCVVGLVV